MKHILPATIMTATAALTTPAFADGLSLDIPVRCTDEQPCFIQQYVDQVAGETYKDFACRRATYNGHKGTDFRVATMNKDGKNALVIAAAGGQVRATRDGEPDISTTAKNAPDVSSKECGNAVVIRHENGWETQYCHLRNGSINVKRGDIVNTGDVLAEIGMSGQAQFPHLHLSIRDDQGQHIDPFNAQPKETGCTEMEYVTIPENSLWSDAARSDLQLKDTAILTSGVHSGAVDVNDVIAGEHAARYLPNTTPAIVYYALFANIHAGDSIAMTILNENAEPFVDINDTIESYKAQYISYVGKPLRDERWGSGSYEGITTVTRDGEVIDTKTFRFDVK